MRKIPQSKMKRLKCAQCGAIQRIKPWQARKRRFCNRRCFDQSLWKGGRAESSRRYDAKHPRKRVHRLWKLVCAGCGKTTEKRSPAQHQLPKYCSLKCWGASRRGTQHPNYSGGKGESRKREYSKGEKAFDAAPMIPCGCGCGVLMKTVDRFGHKRRFILGHQRPYIGKRKCSICRCLSLPENQSMCRSCAATTQAIYGAGLTIGALREMGLLIPLFESYAGVRSMRQLANQVKARIKETETHG